MLSSSKMTDKILIGVSPEEFFRLSFRKAGFSQYDGKIPEFRQIFESRHNLAAVEIAAHADRILSAEFDKMSDVAGDVH